MKNVLNVESRTKHGIGFLIVQIVKDRFQLSERREMSKVKTYWEWKHCSNCGYEEKPLFYGKIGDPIYTEDLLGRNWPKCKSFGGWRYLSAKGCLEIPVVMEEKE
jgi:hypothetical protein